MNICVVHNEYGEVSGEEIVVRSIQRLLNERGHRVSGLFRSSAELEGMRGGKAKAFFTGIYNPVSQRAMGELIERERPAVVHVHNVYPLLSPAVLGECRRRGIPVVMTVHNYRLVCPNGLHMRHGKVCEECLGGKEYRCIVNRCEGSLFKSAGYALRNAVARNLGSFVDNVTIYAALTEFQRQRLIQAGYAADRIVVTPNMVGGEVAEPSEAIGDYVGYIGRVSPEKGVPTLLAAARGVGGIKFRAAGAYARMAYIRRDATANFEFCGHLDTEALERFYRESRIVVLPSECFEGFPTVLVEAMLHGKPVVCSRIGGLPEIVDDGVTGLLFTPGDASDLQAKIRYLWDRPELCRTMGQAGRAKAMREYSSERFYDRLMRVYQRALELGPGGPARNRGGGFSLHV